MKLAKEVKTKLHLEQKFNLSRKSLIELESKFKSLIQIVNQDKQNEKDNTKKTNDPIASLFAISDDMKLTTYNRKKIEKKIKKRNDAM